MRRRGLALAVSVLGVVFAPAAFAGDLPPGGSFYDDDGNVHEGGIEAIAAEGITLGCNPPDNTIFCPDDSVTRGQTAAFLARALSFPEATTDFFTDDDGSVFENAINKIAVANITLGCNPPANTKYCPADFVTRGQMAAFLVRAFGYTDNGGGDLFTDDDDSIFEAAIDKLGTAGVTVGCNPPANDRYCPESLVTRGQMATFLTRALGLSSMVPPPGFIGRFEGPGFPADAAFVTLDIGPTGSDHTVDVVLFEEGGFFCFFSPFSNVTFSGTGTRSDPSHIEITFQEVVCHRRTGDEDVPGFFFYDLLYDPIRDVVDVVLRHGSCFWRSSGGSAADC
jgi:hypothetical protein